ncbi:S8 family serine peptidase [Micromonospora sp. NPDC052213]|uniref:S8 family serine peptidase n=1 Tax=Micromonospora sp. NPDC052213 TaxID=3155812 RepID=UPI00341D853B
MPDTGVEPHPDLRKNLLSGTDTISGGGGDGWQDRNGHGTGMAGLIAAHGQSRQLGALGIAPDAKILPIMSSSASNLGDADDLALGIEFAISSGADVISVSSGGGTSPRLTQAVRTALASDVVIVAGSGNIPFDRTVAYPARESGVLAVGGIDQAGRHAAISATGPEIDVVAPAVDIYSTSIDGKYRKGTGTSDSTAIVAGAAALIRSKYPHLPASEVVHRLTATAVDKGPPGRDDEYGYGVIDLVAALTADVPPLGFGSATASGPAPTASTTTAVAEPADDGDGEATARGLVTLGVIVAAGGAWVLVARRRRHGDDPPPRISR